MRAHPTADRFLTGFLGEQRGRSPEAVDRLGCDLRFAIEVDGPDLLGADDRTLLAAARQVEPVAPVARVLSLPDLARLVARFVLDPAYRPSDPGEAATRLDACAALVRALGAHPALTGHAAALRRADEALRIASRRSGRRPVQG